MPQFHLRRSAPQMAECGSISIFVAVSIIAILGLIALTFDGAGKLNQQERYDDIASEAARAGAQAVDPTLAIPGTVIKVNPQAAVAAAQQYLSQNKLTGTVGVNQADTDITVTVSGTYNPLFAGALGVGSFPVTGHGHAVLVYRVDKP